MNLIKVFKDFEKVKNILKMIKLIEERIKIQDKIKFASLVLFDYYEIIKELVTALLLIDGYKTLSHKDLIIYLELNYNEVNRIEIDKIDKLRILRDRICYDGFNILPFYLERNEIFYMQIIKKLKLLINNKLK